MQGLKALEEQRKPWQVEADRLRAERNANAKAVGLAKSRGEQVEALIVKGERLTAERVINQTGAQVTSALHFAYENWKSRGTSDRNWRGGVGSAVCTSNSVSKYVSPWNGGRPVSR